MSEISGNKQRLLIVDDSKVIRVTARKILQNLFETVEAVDGNNAWEILTSQGPFSLIISDLTMPNLDGFGLLEKIRSSHLPHVCNLPVIIITGANDSKATMQRATAAGATDFIGKPFDSVHLLARTQAHASTYAANVALSDENISLEDRALVDSLTGLANDTAFMEQGCQHLAYAIRHNTSLAVASLEIDSYGELVRQNGADAGELAIKSVGSVLATVTRKEDVAARIGTARFALLLPGMDATCISKLSSRIAVDIGKHAVITGGKRIRFTASIGIAAPAIQADTSFDDLLNAASNSLKLAIAQGGNQIIHDEPRNDEAVPDAAAATDDWTLEPFEKADFSSEWQEGSLPEIEYLQVESPDPLPDLYAVPATDSGSATNDSDPEAEYSESADTTQFDTPFTLETAVGEVEETIIITSPYSLYELHDTDITESAEAADTSMATASEADTAVPPVHGSAKPTVYTSTDGPALEETVDTEIAAARPGVFRRMLRALFGRRE
jgi:diguanylate cyclase (GGDEF)-like protein